MFYFHLANSGMTIFLIYYGTGCRNYGFLASCGRILCVLCTISREASPRICCNRHLYFHGKQHCIPLSFKRVDVIAIIYLHELCQAFAVFILYIRCTSINPADPGIMSQFEDGFIDAPGSTADIQGTNLPAKTDTVAGTNSPTSTYRSSLDGRSNRDGLAAGDANIDLGSQPPRSSRSCLLGGLVCALFIKEDCRKFDDSENQVDGEDALFCTLCNAEVRSCAAVQCFNHTAAFVLSLVNTFCLS